MNTNNKNIENNNQTKEKSTQNEKLSKSLLYPTSQINENVYLGNINDAQNITKLLNLGIKKVLSLIEETQLLKYPNEIEHKLINIKDFPRENIIQYFGDCLLFIDGNKKVLVHCYAGSSRSATVIIAYIMWKNQLGYSEASQFVEQIRPIIFPNYGFVRQLEIFEKLLKKNKYNIHTINFRAVKYPRLFAECCF